jgi:hypothetical protein
MAILLLLIRQHKDRTGHSSPVDGRARPRHRDGGKVDWLADPPAIYWTGLRRSRTGKPASDPRRRVGRPAHGRLMMITFSRVPARAYPHRVRARQGERERPGGRSRTHPVPAAREAIQHRNKGRIHTSGCQHLRREPKHDLMPDGLTTTRPAALDMVHGATKQRRSRSSIGDPNGGSAPAVKTAPHNFSFS